MGFYQAYEGGRSPQKKLLHVARCRLFEEMSDIFKVQCGRVVAYEPEERSWGEKKKEAHLLKCLDFLLQVLGCQKRFLRTGKGDQICSLGR